MRAAPSLPDEYTRAIDGATIGPRVGSCGTAAFTKKQIIVSDIETDPLWADYRDLALRARAAGVLVDADPAQNTVKSSERLPCTIGIRERPTSTSCG